MPSLPTTLTVRAYDVGFGDCLLLSFHYADGTSRHILIDFGSTRLPEGKTGGGNYMERIARQIAVDAGGKLTAVVATHRHKDHISGFARSGTSGPGAIIASLAPEVVLQPWTEDPDIARDAKTPNQTLRGARLHRTLMVKSLGDMNRVAGEVKRVAARLKGRDLAAARRQLAFLGDDNDLKNRTAVVNLMTMGKRRARYLYAGASAGLGKLLPGVRVHVLGPPTVAQDPRVASQATKNADEYWHLRSRFWASRAGMASDADDAERPLFPRHVLKRLPWEARWYARRAQQELTDALLSIVRTLDDAMNNTSLILLFQIGNACVLFPGDAPERHAQDPLEQLRTQGRAGHSRATCIGNVHQGRRPR
jgi:hypothetical protein